MGPHSIIGSDPGRVKGVRPSRAAWLARAWGFARPYRWPILGFLVTIALRRA